MTTDDKIDVIFSKVSKIETDVALIKQRDVDSDRRHNTHEGKLAAIDEVIVAYKIEKAKIIGIAVASGAIFAAIGSFAMWIVGLFYKNN